MNTTPCREGIRFNAVRTGPAGAAPVVLIHAIGLDLSYWGAQIEALRDEFDVLAYDLRGHGSSDAPPEGYALSSLASDLASVVESMGAGSAHLVGLSVGGMIAQTLALARPDLVRSLSLIDTAATLSDQARSAIRQRAALTRQGGMEAILRPTLERWFTPAFVQRRPDVLDRVSKTLLSNNGQIHALMWDAISTLEVAPRLAEVTCPTLVIVGDSDPTTPVAAAATIARMIGGARLVVLDAISHMAPLEAPAQVNTELLSFLRGCEQAMCGNTGQDQRDQRMFRG